MNIQKKLTRSSHFLTLAPLIVMISGFSVGPAYAIPSPELVLSSVSSLSQIAAVAAATISGFGALVLSRLGLSSRLKILAGSGVAIATIVGFVVLLTGLNIWQYQNQNAQEQARMIATLSRPAQFDGTKIKDETLKELRFSSQAEHDLAMTTDQVADVLASAAGTSRVQVFDVRETGENEMGTLPGATHLRFPDFLEQADLTPGQRVVLFCHNGNRSSETCEELAKRGIDCRFMAGGIEKWIVEGRGFSDQTVEELSDLRALPDYPNKDTLISSADFTRMMSQGDVQIVDTRYPGDFAAGHLPGAINIPVRALPTDELRDRINALKNIPTVAACYDRRSCFMSQVLGLEMSRAGIEYAGRFTTPWDYFVQPETKPHIQVWLDEQNETLWSRASTWLAGILRDFDRRVHLVVGLLGLALLTRIAILPVALKAERDQIATRASADQLRDLKRHLSHDPQRKARAIRDFYRRQGMTPGRNLLALLFLPITMLGVASAEKSGELTGRSWLWLDNMGVSDPVYILPVLIAILGVVYLVATMARNLRQGVLYALLGGPALFALVLPLNAAANTYLSIALILMLLQRAYVSGSLEQLVHRVRGMVQTAGSYFYPAGLYRLNTPDELHGSGNKAYRLAVMKEAGLPVPDGLVLRPEFLAKFMAEDAKGQKKLAARIMRMARGQTFAVRSSAANEDGNDQSFAGVFESVLDVDEVGMPAAIRHVMQSFQTDRALSYETEGGRDASILIQQMVQAQYAGVMFTRDPSGPGLNMVEMVQGCGDDLVSGRVTPLSFRFGRYTGQLVGDTPPPVDLSPLIALGHQVETMFGCPQDIEWTYAKGQFAIVQSRDITSVSTRSEAAQLKDAEWDALLNRFAGSESTSAILVQDEMSEVLPRPTPLSFDLMSEIWSPGGSVDLACRELGVPYDMPEGTDGHLVRLFGKTYVDTALKSRMNLHLSESKARRLRSIALNQADHFRGGVIAELNDKIVQWQATDYEKLPVARLLQTLDTQKTFLVEDVYVEAEKINILAGFAMAEAQQNIKEDTALGSFLMHAEMPHAPSTILAKCAELNEEEGRDRALRELGHRSMFDYELSCLRYTEAPTLLWPLIVPAVQPLSVAKASLPDVPGSVMDTINLAAELQDLKEQAKHEALRVVAEMRRLILVLGDVCALGDLVFHLKFSEIFELAAGDPGVLIRTAEARRDASALLRKQAPRETSLTLHDCEVLSAGAGSNQSDATMSGQCVSGEGSVTGRVFWADIADEDPETLFAGFQDGDILVCQMVHPAWLPWVQRSGAVVSEVGGWLSHMAIVAREKQVMMLVGCRGLDRLGTGETVTVFDSGTIDQPDNIVKMGVA